MSAIVIARGARKYVVTRGEKPLTWQNSERVTSIEAVARVKNGDGPDLIIQGSTTLYPQLLAAGLIDRLTLLTYPVVLGSGKRLFGAGTPSGTMRMVDHMVSPEGERRHQTLLAALTAGLPQPRPDSALRAAMRRFFMRLAHGDVLVHFVRIVAIDSAACHLLALLSGRRGLLTTGSRAASILGRIRADEAGQCAADG